MKSLSTKIKRLILSVNPVMIFFAILILNGSVTIVGASDIYVSPDFQMIHESGSVDIWINPSEPIKGLEFELNYNSSMLQADAVVNAHFFGDYPEFFSPNVTIDYENGTITKIYGLVVGQGNVTAQGCVVSVMLSAFNVSGVSYFSIGNAGVTNETMYLPLNVHDGVIQVYGDIPPWDTNGDGIMNFMDISTVASHYLHDCDVMDPWDIRKDGLVNFMDVSLLVCNY